MGVAINKVFSVGFFCGLAFTMNPFKTCRLQASVNSVHPLEGQTAMMVDHVLNVVFGEIVSL